MVSRAPAYSVGSLGSVRDREHLNCPSTALAAPGLAWQTMAAATEAHGGSTHEGCRVSRGAARDGGGGLSSHAALPRVSRRGLAASCPPPARVPDGGDATLRELPRLFGIPYAAAGDPRLVLSSVLCRQARKIDVPEFRRPGPPHPAVPDRTDGNCVRRASRPPDADSGFRRG